MPSNVEQLLKEVSIFVNGEKAGAHGQHVSVLDRGLLYGDSAYEVTILKNGQYLFLEEHLLRLKASLEYLDFPPTDELFQQMRAFFAQLSKQVVSPETTYVRLVVTRGIGPIALGNQEGCSPNWYIITRPLPAVTQKFFDEGVDVEVSSVMRNNIESVSPNCKSGNYLNSILCHQKAIKHKKYEGIMLNRHGHLTEASTHNLWFYNGKELKTPSLDCGILAGITRAKLLEYCREKAIPVSEGQFFKEELYSARQAFLTSSTRGIVPIRACDKSTYVVGAETLCGRLQREFWQHITTTLSQ